jgi:hypothetical protein
MGIPELNIEGACSLPGALILTTRGHKAFPKNYLVFTSREFWAKQSTAPISLVRIGHTKDTNIFEGVSGITYAPNADKLLLTISTEDTRSVHEDGAIGKSYLWIVDNISSKRGWNSINPNHIIDLDDMDDRFKGHKIESICLVGETKKMLTLAVVADNDDGSSSIFSVRLPVGKAASY